MNGPEPWMYEYVIAHTNTRIEWQQFVAAALISAAEIALYSKIAFSRFC